MAGKFQRNARFFQRMEKMGVETKKLGKEEGNLVGGKNF